MPAVTKRATIVVAPNKKRRLNTPQIDYGLNLTTQDNSRGPIPLLPVYGATQEHARTTKAE